MIPNNTSSDCNDEFKFKIIAGINITTGLVSSITATILLLFMLYLRKYHFHPQRLIMYLNVTVIIQGFASVININTFFTSELQDTLEVINYCSFCGFIEQYSLYLQLLIILWIITDLFLMAVFHFYASSKFEIIQVLSTLLLPLILVWVPLINGSYGNTGPMCNIKYVDMDSCQTDKVGYYFLIFIRFVPQGVSMVYILVLYLLTLLRLQREKHHYKGIYDPHHIKDVQELMRKFRALQAYPVIYFMFTIFGVVFAAVEFNQPQTIHPYLQTLAILSVNLQGIAIALAYVIESKTCSRMYIACRKCCISKGNKSLRSASIHTYYTQSMYVSYTDSLVTRGNTEKTMTDN